MKKIFLILFLALVATSVSAVPINVGGVVWDPSSFKDFEMTGATEFNTIAAVGDTLVGTGIVGTLNATGTSTFCPASGCELTYIIGATTSAFDAVLGTAEFTNWTLDLYVDTVTSYETALAGNGTQPALLAAAGDGTLWLSTAGHSIGHAVGGGELFAELTDPLVPGTGDMSGLLDVVGGLAMPNFVPGLEADGSDMVFSGSFQPEQIGALAFTSFGTSDFQSTTVPTPAPLALMGLGLLGLAGVARKSQKRATVSA